VVPDKRYYLPHLREAARYGLREDDVSVDLHVEDAAAPLYQRRIQAEFFLDRGRQAGGAGLIPSRASIRDPDFHLLPPRFALYKFNTRRSPAAIKNPPSGAGSIFPKSKAFTG
jgi:hypothetical protein